MTSNSNTTPQMALPLSVGDKASFDNYWVGHNTELVNAIKSSILRGEPRLVYYYGVPGSGKSHLIFAAMRLAKDEIINTSYVSLSDTYVTPSMLDVIDVKHVVCIDNVQHWAGDELRERALFTLFEQIKHAGGQLLVSASQPPERCGFTLTDLVSRFASGLVYPVMELNQEQQFEAIKMRANHRGLSISDDTVKYLISRSPRDTSELFVILDRIDQASLIEKRRITIPFLQAMFRKA